MDGLIYEDLVRILEKVQHSNDVLQSLTVSPDVEAALLRHFIREAPRVFYGVPIIVSRMFEPGSWVENYAEKDIVHFADGRVLTVLNPRVHRVVAPGSLI